MAARPTGRGGLRGPASRGTRHAPARSAGPARRGGFTSRFVSPGFIATAIIAHGFRADQARTGGAVPAGRGLTNNQIAERLVISPRTVENHLVSLYSKLQVSSRTAAIRFAHEQHLL